VGDQVEQQQQQQQWQQKHVCLLALFHNISLCVFVTVSSRLECGLCLHAAVWSADGLLCALLLTSPPSRAAGDLWLLTADDASTLLDAVLESFRIQDATVRGPGSTGVGTYIAWALAWCCGAAASWRRVLQLQLWSSCLSPAWLHRFACAPVYAFLCAWTLTPRGAPVSLLQVHHRLYVCVSAREQPANTVAKTTVVNITPGTERLAATGLKVSHVVSQSDVVKLLWGNKSVMTDVLIATVGELELDAVGGGWCVSGGSGGPGLAARDTGLCQEWMVQQVQGCVYVYWVLQSRQGSGYQSQLQLLHKQQVLCQWLACTCRWAAEQ
jgi:hypothetical protein